MVDFLTENNYFNVINAFEDILLDNPLQTNGKQYTNKRFNDYKILTNLEFDLSAELFQQISRFEIELQTKIAYYFSKKYCTGDVNNVTNYLNRENYKPVVNSSTDPIQAHKHFEQHAFFKKHYSKATFKNVKFEGSIQLDSDDPQIYVFNGKFKGMIGSTNYNEFLGFVKINNTYLSDSILNQEDIVLNTSNNNITFLNKDFKINGLRYSDFCKIEYEHISKYRFPPLWIIIKTLTLGKLLTLFCGLDFKIQNKIISSSGDFIIKSGTGREDFYTLMSIFSDLRNEVFHGQIISLMKTKNDLKIPNHLLLEYNITPITLNKKISFFDSIILLNKLSSFNILYLTHLVNEYLNYNLNEGKFDIATNYIKRIKNKELDLTATSKLDIINI